jgi:Cu(I)/Ag(I) efflux system membrane fusion protein/cobalt-zinc-cadmium efflux system membrane fusion protein
MKSIKILLIACSLIITSNAVIFAQMQTNGNHSKMGMKKDSVKAEDIVRKGVINLKTIDKNKDGKVFQDQMDFNVISDKPGECPLCGMTLKEVTLKEAKATLLKHGFKVK